MTKRKPLNTPTVTPEAQSFLNGASANRPKGKLLDGIQPTPKSVNMSVTVPENLKQGLDALTKKLGLSRSQVIKACLERLLEEYEQEY